LPEQVSDLQELRHIVQGNLCRLHLQAAK